MKILSIRQPWASLIVLGHKDVENRTWRTDYRGSVLVHASLRADDITADEIERRFGVRLSNDPPRGGIVGVTKLIDCVRPHPSRWYAPEHFAFVLANSRPLPFVRWKGALSLRDAPSELLRVLRADGSEQETEPNRACLSLNRNAEDDVQGPAVPQQRRETGLRYGPPRNL
jgi:hypothetical protein